MDTEKFTYKLIDYIYDNFIQNEHNLEWEQETFDFIDSNLVVPEEKLQIQQNEIKKLKEEIRVLKERLAGLQ